MVRFNYDKLKDTKIFRLMTETVPVLVYVYSGDKVIYVNPEVENTLGYSSEEMYHMNFWDIVHPEYQTLIRDRGHARLQGEDVPSNYEFPIMKKNGELLWVDVFFSRTDFYGDPICVIGAIDITEKKMLQQSLERSHQELEDKVRERTDELTHTNQELSMLNETLNSVVQNISDGVFLIDKTGAISILNPARLNIRKEDYQHIRDKMARLTDETGSFINLLLKSGTPFRDEELIINTSSGQIHLVVTGTPISGTQETVEKGLLLIRPFKEVHRLVNRFVGSRAAYHFEDIVSANPEMHFLIEQAKQAASGLSNIIIEGETGTGKELFAQAIHQYGPRAAGPFIEVNCAAIPRELVGSELFGYSEGAFTGAKKGGNPGKFELASGGTIFLDEIGDMPFEQQSALLRVIENKQVTRIGGNQTIAVDVRIICATNKPLLQEVAQGNFREDLYYRLNVISLNIPPLRNRKEDILLLYKYFLDRMNQLTAENSNIPHDLAEALLAYDWPGNVRQLQNVTEKLLHNSHGKKPQYENLPLEIKYYAASQKPSRNVNAPSQNLLELRNEQKRLLDAREKSQIIELMQLYKGNISAVAKSLGMARSTLYKKLKEYSLD